MKGEAFKVRKLEIMTSVHLLKDWMIQSIIYTTACKNITGKENLYMERYTRMFLNRLLFYHRLNLK